MPSFTSRHYTPDRFRSVSKPEDDLMEDIHQTAPGTKFSSSGTLTLGPSDGSLLDYFDLPSPPSTPHRPTHHNNNLSYSSLNSFPSPATSPGLAARSPATLSRSSSTSSSRNTTPTSSPPTSALPRWPSAAQRIHRLPTRPRSRSTSSASSASSAGSSASLSPPAPALGDIEMGGMPAPPLIRSARRTPYYPPNASRNADRARVYMNRGPHYVPNWTPLSSLPRHVQLQIEERMTRFTAM